jgi:hypothetical protein
MHCPAIYARYAFLFGISIETVYRHGHHDAGQAEEAFL